MLVTGKCLGHVPSPQKAAQGHRRYPTRAGALDVGRAGEAALSDRRTSSSPFLQLPIGWLLEIREPHSLSMLQFYFKEKNRTKTTFAFGGRGLFLHIWKRMKSNRMEK